LKAHGDRIASSRKEKIMKGPTALSALVQESSISPDTWHDAMQSRDDGHEADTPAHAPTDDVSAASPCDYAYESALSVTGRH
jgi:hypothetical protein